MLEQLFLLVMVQLFQMKLIFGHKTILEVFLQVGQQQVELVFVLHSIDFGFQQDLVDVLGASH